jgi:coenzyme F420-reducing hydrogenase delta subunit
VRAIRVMCSSSVSFENILKGFQMGTDGIFVGG